MCAADVVYTHFVHVSIVVNYDLTHCAFLGWLYIQVRQKYMWQSCVEIEGYSVAYFDRIVAFEAPYR